MATKKKVSRKKKPATKKSKPITYIGLILDRSGSMTPIREDARGMFNAQIGEIRKMDRKTETRTTVRTFCTTVDDPLCVDTKAADLKELGVSDYIPNGFTALIDAIGTQIVEFRKIDDAKKKGEDIAFLLLVVTDGEENQSVEYLVSLPDMIKAVTERGNWTLTLLGANVDVTALADRFNIPVGNVRPFQSTKVGTKAAGAVMTSSIGNYGTARACGQSTSKSFYEQPPGDSKTKRPKKAKK